MNNVLLKINSKSVLYLLLVAGIFVSCAKDELGPQVQSEDMPTIPRAVYGSNSVDFNNYSDQRYWRAMAESEFGDLINDSSYDPYNAYVINNRLKVTMPANTVSDGILGRFQVEPSSSYEVSFDAAFYNDFDFREGGKIGFGFVFGDGVAGQFPVGTIQDGNGGTARIMWKDVGNGIIKFKPYLYFMDMPEAYGSNINNAVYPTDAGGLEPNITYRIKMRVKSNTGNDKNGEIHVKINGQEILSCDTIKWANQENKRWVRQLSFETFRGGKAEEKWLSDTDGHIYFDNVVVVKNPQGTF